MKYFIYSKAQSRKEEFIKSSYTYIVLNGENVIFTEQNETGISNFSDSIIVHKCDKSVSCPVLIGYKKTRDT